MRNYRHTHTQKRRETEKCFFLLKIKCMAHIDEWKLNYQTCFRTTHEISASRLNSIKCDIVRCVSPLDSGFGILCGVCHWYRHLLIMEMVMENRFSPPRLNTSINSFYSDHLNRLKIEEKKSTSSNTTTSALKMKDVYFCEQMFLQMFLFEVGWLVGYLILFNAMSSGH